MNYKDNTSCESYQVKKLNLLRIISGYLIVDSLLDNFVFMNVNWSFTQMLT